MVGSIVWRVWRDEVYLAWGRGRRAEGIIRGFVVSVFDYLYLGLGYGLRR